MLTPDASERAAQRERVKAAIRARAFDWTAELPAIREAYDALLTSRPLPPDVELGEDVLGGVRAVTVDVPQSRPGTTALHLHGGGYVAGTADGAAGLAAQIARRLRTRVIIIDYRLAPEHPHPAAIDDTRAVYTAILERGANAGTIVFTGESAGAGILAATLPALRDADLPQPAAAVLMSPWVDLSVSGHSAATKADEDPVLTPAVLHRFAQDYLAGIDPTTGAVSPIHADYHGVAPLLIQVGSAEILLDDAIRLAHKAATDDVSVRLEVWPGAHHVFQAMSALLTDGADALDSATAHLTHYLPPIEWDCV
jgi:acetyl esterase/lipase